MKKAIFAVLCAALLIAVFSCGDDDDSAPKVVGTYTGTDADRQEYVLKVKSDNTYEFFIAGASISTGTASKAENVFTLKPNADGGENFTVTVEGKKITAIEGTIAPDSGEDPITPGEIVEIKPIAGVWEWSLSDDSFPNAYKGSTQSIFAPGGASRITNALSDPNKTDEHSGFPVKRPFVQPAGTIKDNDGNVIDATVYNFTGNTKVSSEGRSASEGARFPLVGWEAVPDEDTLELLKTVYGYSFWVRLNSSTASNWSFLTAVVTDFTPEEGHEYKHWFGNQPGDSGGKGAKNFTSKLELNKWYKITVVMDTTDNGFNMFQDKWIWQYDSGSAFRGDFHQSAAQKIQWQIPLQHQAKAGVKARGGEPYDITNGSYDFNVDFYGLELIP